MVLKPFSFNIIWGFVRNANSLAQDRTYQVRNSGTVICLDIAPCDSDLHWILRTMSFGSPGKVIVSALEALCSPLLQMALETRPPTTHASGWPGIEIRHKNVKSHSFTAPCSHPPLFCSLHSFPPVQPNFPQVTTHFLLADPWNSFS